MPPGVLDVSCLIPSPCSDVLPALTSVCPENTSSSLSVQLSWPLLCKAFLYYFFLNLWTYLAALGLHCCTRTFSCCGEWGLLFTLVLRLLIAVPSLVVEHGL